MSKRADKTKDKTIDPDSTDELPALDVAGSKRRAAWRATTRATPIPGARQQPAAAGGEPAIFDTIRSLEASLHAKSERTADLEQLLARAERERETAERRLREREQALSRAERELESSHGGAEPGSNSSRRKRRSAAQMPSARPVRSRRTRPTCWVASMSWRTRAPD